MGGSQPYVAVRVPGTHCIGGWVGSRAGLDVLEKRKISGPNWDSYLNKLNIQFKAM